MDTVSFEPVEIIFDAYGGEEKYLCARVIINGKCLDEIAREYELSFALEAGCPDYAGAYEHQIASELHRYLTDKNYRGDDKIGLLICNCMCEGCWPLYATMVEEDDVIIWRDFYNPHLSGNNGKYHVDYQNWGEFRFDKDHFGSAVERLGVFLSHSKREKICIQDGKKTYH